MPKIELIHVTKRWGDFFGADDLNMTIEDRGFVTLLGPSGCGKTTTLRMIAGLETPTSGTIKINGQTVFSSHDGINVPPNKRHVGFLFQNYALWPHMTVYKNIHFGLENVKEEMPLHASEMEKYAKLAKAAKNLALIRKSAEEAVNMKSKKIDEDKYLLNLIDNFEISMSSAKELRALKVETLDDVSAQAALVHFAEACLDKANLAHAKIVAKGYEVDDKYDYIDPKNNNEPVVKKRHLDKEEMDLRLRHVARVVKIGEFMDRYPSELSGGQQQRVAIARTLAPGPKVLFMDEPLSNLDAKLRLEMRAELKRLHVETGSTFVYVTHDQLEAMTLATKICLINNGVIQQYDPPLTVYSRPNNIFVADFVGNPAINFIEVKAAQNGDKIALKGLDGHLVANFVPNEPLSLEAEVTLRKEEAQKAEEEAAARRAEKGFVEKGNTDKAFNYHIPTVNGTLDSKEERNVGDDDYLLAIRPEFIKEGKGSLHAEVYAALPSGMETTIRLRIGDYILTGVVFGGVDYPVGQKVDLDVRGNRILLYDRHSEKLISTGRLELLPPEK